MTARSKFSFMGLDFAIEAGLKPKQALGSVMLASKSAARLGRVTESYDQNRFSDH